MIYVIGDLHLSNSVDKKMDVFGDNWTDYHQRIIDNWKAKVKEDDTVIIAGDFSWGINYEESKEDFAYLSKLPGKKIILKGNHDLWWSSVKKNNDFLKENGFSNITFLYNNAYIIEDIAICGTRFWEIKDVEDAKIARREKLRLELSIEDMNRQIKKFGKDGKDNIKKVCITHYPPYIRPNDTLDEVLKEANISKEEVDIISLCKENGISDIYYGHLHGKSCKGAIVGDYEGVNLTLISGDYIDFDPVKID